MKISIITAVYNAEKFLVDFFESIKSHDIDDYELIIIDGGSKDRSVEIIKSYSKYIKYWISEPDKGIYDAWNKGVLKASGEWIMFLGADDKLVTGALKDYKKYIIDNTITEDNCLYISSKMQIIDDSGKMIRIKGWPWEWPFFLKEMTVAHPGSLHSPKLFRDFGLFDPSYRSSGDYELLLRPKSKLNGRFFDQLTVIMLEGGMSDSFLGIEEHRRAAIKTGGANPFVAYLNSYWVGFKFLSKKTTKRLGLNLYLKK
ncbi:glycosyltransferase family 2 protein [Pedobacter sp. AW31-3R]|uniref:glycosyltransferase family 2 protein n=1 Tax=Pedobacter sp. AW31-3R TaxID=3445781 RepID=UPI003F9FFDBA